MRRERLRLVVSDFHLGAGAVLPDGSANYLEDFFHDAMFAEFLDYHGARGICEMCGRAHRRW